MIKPGDLVSVHEIKFGTKEIVEDGGFLLGNMSGMGSDLYFPSGTPALILEVGRFPHLVRDEDIVILLIDGHTGWAYEQECRPLSGGGGIDEAG